MAGKEGYPTWAYDYSASHNKQFIEILGPYRGTTNEKIMVRSSPLVALFVTNSPCYIICYIRPPFARREIRSRIRELREMG
jgi:hypothetical protein